MRRDPGLTPWDWELTPPAARHVLLALRQQVRLLRLRSTAYEQQIAELRQQLDTIDDLRAEIAELRERLGQNSRNSSKPPSSDPPSYQAKPPTEPRGRKRGAQPGHRGHSRRLKPETEVTQRLHKSSGVCHILGREV
jgi:Family of unknown function (DUF6444)